jgi:hypothetical protein
VVVFFLRNCGVSGELGEGSFELASWPKNVSVRADSTDFFLPFQSVFSRLFDRRVVNSSKNQKNVLHENVEFCYAMVAYTFFSTEPEFSFECSGVCRSYDLRWHTLWLAFWYLIQPRRGP